MKIPHLIILIVILLCGACVADETPTFAIHSKTYGTWSPPDSLVDFWKGMKDNWWNPSHPNEKELVEYFNSYTRSHDIKKILPAIIEDLKKSDTPLRFGLYSSLILHWNRRQAKAILHRYESSKDPREREIADNFVADIEEVETHK